MFFTVCFLLFVWFMTNLWVWQFLHVCSLSVMCSVSDVWAPSAEMDGSFYVLAPACGVWGRVEYKEPSSRDPGFITDSTHSSMKDIFLLVRECALKKTLQATCCYLFKMLNIHHAQTWDRGFTAGYLATFQTCWWPRVIIKTFIRCIRGYHYNECNMARPGSSLMFIISVYCSMFWIKPSCISLKHLVLILCVVTLMITRDRIDSITSDL